MSLVDFVENSTLTIDNTILYCINGYKFYFTSRFYDVELDLKLIF